jgi:AcrR family transcriptional regulator
MPRHRGDTKRRIMDAAYRLFYKGGFERASVDAIAEASGVTKRTLYYHFDSKQALVKAVLAAQNELALALAGRWAGQPSEDPASVVERLFAEFSAWVRQPGWRGSGFTRAAMEYAHLPGHPARIAARRHKAAVESRLAERLSARSNADALELARELMLLIEGCHTLVLIHGDPGYADAAARAARMLVASATRRRGAGAPRAASG